MADIILTPTHDSLTLDELHQTLEIMGLRLFRFRYCTDASHELSLRLQVFVDGRTEQTCSDLPLHQREGAQQLTVYLYQRGDAVEVSIRGVTNTVGWPAISTEGYNARTWYQYPASTLGSDSMRPLFVHAANRERIQGIGCTSDGCGIETVPLDTIVSGYDWVLVVSALIKSSD